MSVTRRSILAATLAVLTWGGAAVSAQDATLTTPSFAPSVGQAGKDVIWVPTPQGLVDRMLDMAKLTPQDKLVDLGSGDGRTVITAAQRGATARGIEFNPDMVELSRKAAADAGVADRARFEQADIFESDFSEATVITLFLLPHLNVRLRPTILDMPAGTRVVSNSFDMGDWQPDDTAGASDNCTHYCNAYMWVVPAKVAGTWTLGERPLQLSQTYQMLSGTLGSGSAAQDISEARMDGAQIRFTVGNEQYTGQVEGNQMKGTTASGASWQATRQPS